MTETEAMNKWCPFARTVESNGGCVVQGTAHNRKHHESNRLTFAHPNNCLVSDCMAWRTDGGHDSAGVETGYCGLAGKP